MRKKRLFSNCRIPMNLQIFAEGGDTGDDGGGSGAGGSAAGESSGNEPMSFDDFLRGDGNQAEYDRRVREAVSAAVASEKSKWQAMTDDKLSEAEKLAKMTKEEKAEYLQQKREKELTDRETAVMRKELMAEAKNTLAEKKLPVDLAEVLDYADADACKKSIATVEKAFQKAVKAAVDERLKGGEPPRRPPEADETSLAKQVENLMLGIY